MNSEKLNRVRAQGLTILEKAIEEILLELTHNRVISEINGQEPSVDMAYMQERLVLALDKASQYVNREMRKQDE